MLRTTHDADIIANLEERLEACESKHRPDCLSAVERQIVAFARFDPISSLRPLRRSDRFLAWLFGMKRPNQLADPRLEALRRFAVLCWKERKADLDSFLAAGYSIVQAEAVRHRIEAVRPRKASRVPWITGLLAVASASALAIWLHSYFEDWLVAVLLGVITLLSTPPVLSGAKAPRI